MNFFRSDLRCQLEEVTPPRQEEKKERRMIIEAPSLEHLPEMPLICIRGFPSLARRQFRQGWRHELNEGCQSFPERLVILTPWRGLLSLERGMVIAKPFSPRSSVISINIFNWRRNWKKRWCYPNPFQTFLGIFNNAKRKKEKKSTIFTLTYT